MILRHARTQGRRRTSRTRMPRTTRRQAARPISELPKSDQGMIAPMYRNTPTLMRESRTSWKDWKREREYPKRISLKASRSLCYHPHASGAMTHLVFGPDAEVVVPSEGVTNDKGSELVRETRARGNVRFSLLK